MIYVNERFINEANDWICIVILIILIYILIPIARLVQDLKYDNIARWKVMYTDI